MTNLDKLLAEATARPWSSRYEVIRTASGERVDIVCGENTRSEQDVINARLIALAANRFAECVARLQAFVTACDENGHCGDEDACDAARALLAAIEEEAGR